MSATTDCELLFDRMLAADTATTDENSAPSAERHRPKKPRRPAAASSTSSASVSAAVAGSTRGCTGARRNARERNRVRQVNAGFDVLRCHVPQGQRNKKLSKVDTLRAAVDYISQLQTLLNSDDDVTQQWYPSNAMTLLLGNAEGQQQVQQQVTSSDVFIKVDQNTCSPLIFEDPASRNCQQTLTFNILPPPVNNNIICAVAEGVSSPHSTESESCYGSYSGSDDIMTSSLRQPQDEDADRLLDWLNSCQHVIVTSAASLL